MFKRNKRKRVSVSTTNAVGNHLRVHLRKIAKLSHLHNPRERVLRTPDSDVDTLGAAVEAPDAAVDTPDAAVDTPDAASDKSPPKMAPVESSIDKTCADEANGTYMDSSASSPSGNSFSDRSSSLDVLSPASSVSEISSLVSSPVMPKQSKLEAKLAKLAKYGKLLHSNNSVSPEVLKEIAWDSGIFLEEACDPETMKQLFESGTLKQMVDEELLRRFVEFCRLWVDAQSTGEANMP